MDPLLLTAGAALASLGAYAASCFAEVRGVHDWWLPGAVWRSPHPHVVLTFDDGPDPERTPRLLDVLAAADAKAMFFVVGERVARHPQLVRRIAAEGHQLGNHSWSHPWFVASSRRRIEDEVDRCQDAILQAAGVEPSWARPPYGQRDARVYRVYRDRGLTPVLWSRNLRDYYGGAAPTLARRLARARPGEIVLCHDGDPKAPHTVEAVEAYLAGRPPLGPLSLKATPGGGSARRARSSRPGGASG